VTTTSDDTRPQRRSTGQPWLDRKYSQQPADPRLTAWADAAVEKLYGARRMLASGPYDSQQKAQRAKNALYDAVNKRWNREHPDMLLSLSANVTDPDDGKCYARSQCRCEQNECRPTPGPGWYVHARLYDKRDGRAHQARKPRDAWDYDPLARRPRRRGQQPPGTVAAPGQPGQRFGLHGNSTVPPDDPTRGPKASGGQPRRKPETRQPAKTGKEATAGKDASGPPEAESVLSKLRRWAG
jgi:hypothetical protein